MIDRIQTWLDLHPRTRFTGRATTATVAALLYIGIFTVAYGVLGVVAAGLIIAVVHLAGALAFTSVDAVWGAWTAFVGLGAIVGAIIGLIRALLRVVRDDPDERRSRTIIARDLVAQAVVARRIGAETVALQLGILGGGDMRWSYTVRLNGGPSTADQAYDRLTVQLANPSLVAGTDFRVDEQRRSWFAEISATAEEIIIHRAVEGSAAADISSVIASAAQRARAILAETDGLFMTAIESELRTAGSIRSARFHALLGSAVESPATAEALF
ncbi:hypothetical protein ACH3VR_22130 [Microbacterium sp. B2969]|uniref:Uncharacterized protein n=1 Tax=Microbacterium alkaliflavum TaxID=3248839 RepID=A0ABW7QF47_9MICO